MKHLHDTSVAPDCFQTNIIPVSNSHNENVDFEMIKDVTVFTRRNSMKGENFLKKENCPYIGNAA